jgi:capsular polysaccharide transport system permease protein
MGHSEELINRLNKRARADSIRFAADVVAKAEARVTEAQASIAEFRSTERLFDPAQQSTATIELMNSLAAEIVQLRAVVSELRTTAPNSPQINALQVRIGSLEKQVAEQRESLTGNSQSLAPKLSRYEQLVLERELATKSLSSALATLENARQDGERQQLYLERIVAPALPDHPTHPRRLTVMLTALLVLGSLYCVLRWLYDVVMEHQA